MKTNFTLLLLLISFYGFAQDATFSYPLNIYCIESTNPTPIVVSDGGFFIINNNGVIDMNTGEINLIASHFGIDNTGNFTITHTTPTESSTFNLRIIKRPLIDSHQDVVVCDLYELPPIIGTNLSGNEVYYTAPNGNGTSYHVGSIINYNDFSSYPVTFYIYDGADTVPNCSDETSFMLTIEENDSSFSYPNSIYAINDANPIPVNIVTLGGVFTIDNGANINAFTGEIDLSSTTVNQTYTITYLTQGICSNISTFSITIIESLNIEDNITSKYISIYPNPTKKYFYLKNESNLVLEKLEIINYLGEIVKKVDLKNRSLEKQISINSLNTDIYFIKINSEKHQIIKKLIVK